MTYDLSLVLLFFFAYAFIGWIHEILFRLVTERRIYTTGFLTMPILPIYGFGAIAILLLVAPYVQNPFVVFLFGVIISTVLEYVGHLLIDKIFHIKLWDYSDKAFNLQGRVCLQNSLGFGALTLLLVYVLHPLVGTLIIDLPENIAILIATVLSTLLVVDFANSVISLLRVRMQKIKGTLKDVQVHIKSEISYIRKNRKVPVRFVQLKKALLQIHRLNIQRLANAYPAARRR